MVGALFLEKNFPSSNGHLLDFGGGLNPCQLCTLMYRQNGDLANLLKLAPKKVPQSAQMSAGRGVTNVEETEEEINTDIFGLQGIC